MINWYQQLLKDGTLLPDEAQRAAVQALSEFSDTLSTASDKKKWQQALHRWFSNDTKPAHTGGVYLYGGVGRGKTLLMDGFYLQLQLPCKLRVHFHQFMRRLHQDIKKAERAQDPLAQVAGTIADQFDLICFDEFHVSNITDAMLLGRLLEQLFAADVRFIMTSNYPPDGLYPNGLGRDRFLPAIALLKDKLRVIALDGSEDYRRRMLAGKPVYFSPWTSPACQEQMQAAFNQLTGGIRLQNDIKLGDRRVPAVARTSDCIWFAFDALCGSARAKSDYLQLAERFTTVFLSAVPSLDDDALAEAAKRFTWLVDILYDAQIRLIIGADTELDKLYGSKEGGESGRTLSRLIAMQSDTYGSEPLAASA